MYFKNNLMSSTKITPVCYIFTSYRNCWNGVVVATGQLARKFEVQTPAGMKFFSPSKSQKALLGPPSLQLNWHWWLFPRGYSWRSAGLTSIYCRDYEWMGLYLHSILRFRGMCDEKLQLLIFYPQKYWQPVSTNGLGVDSRCLELTNCAIYQTWRVRRSETQPPISPARPHTPTPTPKDWGTSLVICTLPQQRFSSSTSGYWQYFSLASLTFWRITTVAIEQLGISHRMYSLQVEEFKTRQNPYLQQQQLRILFKVKQNYSNVPSNYWKNSRNMTESKLTIISLCRECKPWILIPEKVYLHVRY